MSPKGKNKKLWQGNCGARLVYCENDAVRVYAKLIKSAVANGVERSPFSALLSARAWKPGRVVRRGRVGWAPLWQPR